MRRRRSAMGRSLRMAVCALGVLLAGSMVAAEPEPKLEGQWEGVLEVPGGKLRIIFKISREPDGGFSGVMASPDQGAAKIVVDRVSVDGGEVNFQVAAIRGGYQGQLSGDGSTLEGTWQQGGQSHPLVLTHAPGEEVKTPDPDEIWEGSLEVSGTRLRLVFRVFATAGGPGTALMDSPDQGITGIEVVVTGEGETIRFGVQAIGGEFKGKKSDDGLTLQGEWTQGGLSLPLVLKRTEAVSELLRPQEPARPYPYRQEEVSFPGGTPAVRLAGTLTVPASGGPFPAALLISGSGPQDRDETVFGHRPFLILADHLTRRGIAVLRVDDRGVGGSTGDSSMATTDDFVEDALAGVKFLKSRSEVDPGRVGLVGHSEGGLIAPRAAVRSEDVTFIVMLAGPGLPGEEILTLQGAAIGRAAGWPEKTLALHRTMQERVFAVLQQEKNDESARREIEAALRDMMAEASEAERRALSLSEEAIAVQARAVTSPWFRFFLAQDPVSTLRQVTCPVLALNGELDLQVPADANLEAIEKALATGGNKRYQVKKMPGLNHLMQTAVTGSPAEYAEIEETMSPAVLELIAGWILEQAPNAS